MDIKYQNEVSQFDCDLTKFKEVELESYRWTFEDINDTRNFEPIYINDPKRKQDNCLGFALSFFTKKEAGINRLKELTLNKEKLFKKLGTHISSGVLNKSDGIAGEPDNIKHFDFFVYRDVELKDKFTVLESIA
ncbi:hypothetical protein CHRY9390_02649 [Chryseobacterium aquaeductus]|uniref:Uncharacterized protein n=1 Tax=Chryseobacterium aquaeductus TaxID=2675056 RepID=A0A9N8QRD8_9FLAO|nr:hypothetical protein [Chryseobacterium aquaeductus]CAA7331931.1 hypothetical protein CHRY9390_02649 [Chryseobacterium potabilaquae]CAD7813381.1 hypothetical protein CHRY9390_02649 [Chryseobacterium aquaeductus]